MDKRDMVWLGYIGAASRLPTVALAVMEHRYSNAIGDASTMLIMATLARTIGKHQCRARRA